MASPCQGTQQDLSANSSNIALNIYVCKTSHIYWLLNSYTFFKFMNAILRNWECLKCGIRPDCHHEMLAGLQTRCLTSSLKGLWWVPWQWWNIVQWVDKIDFKIARLSNYGRIASNVMWNVILFIWYNLYKTVT